MAVEYSASTIPRSSATVPRDSAEDTTLEKAAGAQRLSIFLAQRIAVEFLVVACTAYLASALYYRIVFFRWPPASGYIPAALFIAALVVLVSLGFRDFKGIETRPRHRFLWNGIGAVAIAFSLFLSTVFLLKLAEEYSRATFFFQFLGVAVAVLVTRSATYSSFQSAIASGRLQARRAVLVGSPADCRRFADRLKDAAIHGVGAFELPSGHDRNSETTRKLVDDCRRVSPDDVLILATPGELATIPRLAEALSELPVSLHVIPTGAGDLLSSSRLAELGSVATIQLLHAPLSAFDRFMKRAFDLTAALMGLIVFLPLLLIVSIAIKIDSRGPVLFRQTRHGYNNDAIRVFKFRTMTTVEDSENFAQAVKNDPRVTQVGRLLRSTNIDELPQLLNVVLGQMSIVGPRPHPIALNKMFDARISPFSRRHNVKPGITGWAQVHGYRGETNTIEKMQRRVEYDLYYIDNWSFVLDMKIILMTLFSKSAYTNAY